MSDVSMTAMQSTAATTSKKEGANPVLGIGYAFGEVGCQMSWYMINNLNTLFFQKMYTEGLGGSTTLRGVNRNSVMGEGFAFANLELRWRIVGFQFINQNWQVGLNPFFDAGLVTQNYRDEKMKEIDEMTDFPPVPQLCSGEKERLHMSAGCGLKLIMNRNLVVSVDLGKALDKRDGEKLKTFVGFNYIF